MIFDDDVARLDWSRSAVELDRWIRGCDPNPGAHAERQGETVRLFGARLASQDDPGAEPGTVLEAGEQGLRIAARGGVLEVAKVRLGAGPKQAAPESGLAAGERLR